ncbi:hypothetical protein DBIPINDM_001408 [Mesorhizobium sp. AR02]|uniref:hypothetical protein n=1 Tax=Mesorhizobium sp. AR02 TaxID=2865837 RepID=UPI0021607368|nr:hypothetical protein [Mesorhizobium sp. AR02]UVK54928.1 hypothetical protein DBIPINDM_001408 [Mesorhizobium sp. AR02]
MNSKSTPEAAMRGENQNLTPERRFPEFQEAGAWKTISLGSAASISKKKVGDNNCIPMTVTSGVGLVSQIEKFGRIIAGESYKNYLLLQKDEFAYNKSATKEYPEGFIALYTGEELAAVPNSIFTCFRIKGESLSPKYLNHLFRGNLHGQWLRKFIEVGARAHGSLSINDLDLLALPVPIPGGASSLAIMYFTNMPISGSKMQRCNRSDSMATIRRGGPEKAVRPFAPGMGTDDPEFQKVEALDHIARALSGIDHNIEALAHHAKLQNDLLSKILVAISTRR